MNLRVALLAVLLFIACSLAPAAEGRGQSFRLKEYLDHDWSRELVLFPVDADVARGMTLLDPDGKPCLSQIVPGEKGARIAFLADLPAGADRTWVLGDRTNEPAPESDLKIEKTGESLKLTTSLVGVEVPTARGAFDSGPISSVRLRSGTWVGGSRLRGVPKITRCESRVTAAGPAFGEIECRYEFEGGTTWTLRLRLVAGEPVVTVDETFTLPGKPRWTFVLGKHFDRAAYRNPSPLKGDPSNAHIVKDLKTHSFLLCPWLLWWMPNGASFISLFKAEPGIEYVYDPKKRATLRLEQKKLVDPMTEGDRDRDEKAVRGALDKVALTEEAVTPDQDVLFIAAGHAGDWARPGQNGMGKCVPLRRSADAGVYLDLQLSSPGRKWAFGTSTIARTIVPDGDLPDAQRYLIKYCETPLQQVHEMTLEWEAVSLDDYRWLFIDKADVPTVCERLKGRMPNHPYAGKYYYGFLCNPTPEMKQGLRENVLAGVQHAVEVFTENIESRLRGGDIIRRPSAPAYNHHVTMRLMSGLVTSDLALGGRLFSGEELARLRAKLAFLGYKVGSPDFYSLERNWRANPNMTTMRHSVIGILGALLPRHPESKTWVQLGLGEIERQLKHWVGPNGGWLECPHYQTLLSEAIALLLAAHTAGYSDMLYDERLLRTVLYMAKICTPPDPRFGNRRTFQPTGNTYRFETSCLFAILAKLHSERNPEAANALQWMWDQQGRPTWLAIGGNTAMNQYTHFLMDYTDPKHAPDWQSEVFPLSGTILRTGFPGPRETQLYMLHGPFNQHYDHDRGCIAVWGKGWPLSLDWGYAGRMPSDMHSMMNIGNNGRVTAFSAQPRTDYVLCDLGAWKRQILFVKDAAPTGANYFLMRDSTTGRGTAKWNLWLYTKELVWRDGNVVRMKGHGDVDLDIWFAGRRAAVLKKMSAKDVRLSKPPQVKAKALGDDMQLGEEFTEGIARPKGPEYIYTREESVTVVAGYLERAGWNYAALKQRGLPLSVKRGETVFAVLYPRLRKEKPAVFHELADGRGVRVESAAADPVDGFWRIRVKRGFLGEMCSPDSPGNPNPFKRPLIQLEPGAVLRVSTGGPRPFYGRMVRNVAPGFLKAVQCGYTLAAPCRWQGCP